MAEPANHFTKRTTIFSFAQDSRLVKTVKRVSGIVFQNILLLFFFSNSKRQLSLGTLEGHFFSLLGSISSASQCSLISESVVPKLFYLDWLVMTKSLLFRLSFTFFLVRFFPETSRRRLIKHNSNQLKPIIIKTKLKKKLY